MVTPGYNPIKGKANNTLYLCWKCDETSKKMVVIKQDDEELTQCGRDNSAKRFCFFPPGDKKYQGNTAFGTGLNCSGQVSSVSASGAGGSDVGGSEAGGSEVGGSCNGTFAIGRTRLFNIRLSEKEMIPSGTVRD